MAKQHGPMLDIRDTPSNELAFIQAWIDNRYNAFTQSYLYRIRQEISHGDDYLEGFLDDVTACNKFNEKYP